MHPLSEMLQLLGLSLVALAMTYVIRTHVAPGDLGEAADNNQGMDNEEALKAAFKTRQVTVIFDGGGAVLVAGTRLGFAWKGPVWTLTEWEAAELEGTSGSCVFDVWRGASAIPTSAASSIVGGGNKPTLSSAIRTAAAPASWTDITIDPNDEIILNVDSATTVRKVAVTLKGTVAV